ncbi:MAG: hypothetical protein JJE22_15655 [Bacteroidia bacterium]|nr:hypothetical protein [Bacteroidia bacterium]
MKKLFFFLQVFLFLAFNFFLLMAGYQWAQSSSPFYYPEKGDPKFAFNEDFDPSLLRLNTLKKLTSYCDSLYVERSNAGGEVKFEETFPQIVLHTMRDRFYHGYSLYGMNNNFMAMLLSKVSLSGLNAIVIPDDILKYPYAACSQQSIVFMEILRQKGFNTRKVGFNGKIYGHFCFEVFYNGSWHFYDPDMEPDVAVLNTYNRPGIEFLVRHPDILFKAYHQYPKAKVMDIFPNYFYGAENTFEAPRAMIFQQLTKIFSYTIWIFFLIAFILARKKYIRLSRNYVRNSRIHFPRVQSGTSPVHYSNYSA